MPYIQIKNWTGRTKEEKALLAEYITDAAVRAYKVPPQVVTIVFQDVPKEDWAIGGKLCCDLDK